MTHGKHKKLRRRLNRFAYLACLVCLVAPLLACPGCVRLGDRVQAGRRPEGAPTAREIVRDLRAQQAGLRQFEATGKLLLRLPESPAVRSFGTAKVVFSEAHGVHISASKRGIPAFRLTADGDSCLVELSLEKRFDYAPPGEPQDWGSGPASPVALARELLFGSDWSTVTAKQIRVTGFDPASAEVTVEILGDAGDDKEPRQRVVLYKAQRWLPVRSVRLSPVSGAPVLETIRSDYRAEGETFYAAAVEVRSPEDDAWMRLELRKLTPDATVDETLFDVDARQATLRERGYDDLEETR